MGSLAELAKFMGAPHPTYFLKGSKAPKYWVCRVSTLGFITMVLRRSRVFAL